MLPTIRDVLALPALAAGNPVVRAGGARLDETVRWVHVSDQREPAGTLSGGELVLSIGAAAADPMTDHAAYLTALRDAGAVGLVIELGQHLTRLPGSLVQAARTLRFPLVELRGAVRFVAVTEVVHAWVLDEQHARVRSAQHVIETFRSSMVDDVDVPTVVTRAAELLGVPVVLEDLGHRALAHAGEATPTLLRDWSARSRQATGTTPPGPFGAQGWFATPVGPPRGRWGRLVVPRRSPDDERLRLVLAQAADAISVLTRSNGGAPGVVRQAENGLLADIVAATGSRHEDLRARARALGVDPDGEFVAAVLVGPVGGRGTGTGTGAGTDGGTALGARSGGGTGTGTDADQDRRVLDGARDTAARLRLPALVGRLQARRVAVVLPCPSPDAADGLVSSVRDALGADTVRVVATADAPVVFDDLAGALADALETADVADAAPDAAAVPVWRPRHLGARRLVRRLRDDPRLLGFVTDQLGPLLRLDEPQRSTASTTLRAYLDADGAVTGLATRIGTSRPSAYARLRRLSALLGRDLEDAEIRFSMRLALLALDQIDA